MIVKKRGHIRRLPNGKIYIRGWEFEFPPNTGFDMDRVERWAERLMRRLEAQKARKS